MKTIAAIIYLTLVGVTCVYARFIYSDNNE